MSDKHRSRTDDGGGGGGGGSGGGANADGAEAPGEAEDLKEDKCKGCERKGKRTPFFRLGKSNKLRHQKRNRRGIYVNSGCLCLKRPRTLDSDESPTSDPNSSEFTFDMLRALIENNDFYSKECNPHLDAV